MSAATDEIMLIFPNTNSLHTLNQALTTSLLLSLGPIRQGYTGLLLGAVIYFKVQYQQSLDKNQKCLLNGLHC